MKRKKTSEDAEPLPKTHDALVRLNFSDLAQVRDLFQHYLPRKWQSALDLHLLKAVPIQLVRRNLRSLMPDFLFEIPYSNRDDSALVSLQIEHQSSPDFSLPIRLAQSRIEIWHQWLRQNPGKSLPIVLSLVFYTGGQAYPYSLRLQDMLADPCGLFAEQFSALLIDLSQVPDEELQELKRSSSWLRLMKHIYDHRLSSALIAEILADLNQLPGNMPLQSQIEILLVYCLYQREDLDFSELAAQVDRVLPPPAGEWVMTVGEKLEQKGRQMGRMEGRQEGRMEGRMEGEQIGMQRGMDEASRAIARKMYAAGMAVGEIAKLTGLSLREVQRICQST
jgi:predicted transposase/invertase (TIGR01784 family)